MFIEYRQHLAELLKRNITFCSSFANPAQCPPLPLLFACIAGHNRSKRLYIRKECIKKSSPILALETLRMTAKLFVSLDKRSILYPGKHPHNKLERSNSYGPLR